MSCLFKRKTKQHPDFSSWAKYLVVHVKNEFNKKRFKKDLSKAMNNNIQYRIEAFFKWENDINFYMAENIYGVAFVVSHLVNHDCSMLEIVLYSKKGYKASQVGLSFKLPCEVFEWLGKKETPQKCSQILIELLDILNSED